MLISYRRTSYRWFEFKLFLPLKKAMNLVFTFSTMKQEQSDYWSCSYYGYNVKRDHLCSLVQYAKALWTVGMLQQR